MLEKPILQSDLITLRPLIKDDADTMFAEVDNAEVNRLTGTTEKATLEQYRAHYARLLGAQDRVDYAIIPNELGTVVGEVVLNDIDARNRSANFRIMLLNEGYFGKGYGTEATKLILKHGFERLDLHRVDLEVYDFNPRAARVYEKAGFVREGVKRDVLFWDGAYHSAVVMGILKPEFERSFT